MEAHKLARNVLSVFMALVLVVGFCPYAAYAAESGTASASTDTTQPNTTDNSGTASTDKPATEDPSTPTDPVTPPVEKQKLDVSKVKAKATSFTYNGKKQSLSMANLDKVPKGVKVTWSGVSSATKGGTYTATAKFTLDKGYSSDKYQIVGKDQLTVKWDINYKLSLKLNGGKMSGKTTLYFTDSKSVKNLKPTKKGYTFQGWYASSKFKGKKVTSVSKENKTLYAKWTKNSYKITYKLNGGKNNSKNPSKYTVTTSTIKLKNPTRSGYAFQGWYSNKALTKKVTSIAKGSTGGKTLYAKWKKLSATNAMQSKANSYSSKTKYLILVNCKTHKVGIYKGKKGSWKNVKYWSCTTGKSSTPTKKGVFTVKAKGKSFGSGYTCWYYTQFYGNYLFHSVLYRQGSMSQIKDGRLGISASHGCVRLSLGNAKWIYNNIPSGTKVVVY